MSLGGVRSQMSGQLELPLSIRGEAPRGERSEETPTVASGNERSGASDLMERVVNPSNIQAALKRVRQNKGSPGIDGMTVEELSDYLQGHWDGIREELLAGTYQPKPVRKQLIPKSGGGGREVGTPPPLFPVSSQAPFSCPS